MLREEVCHSVGCPSIENASEDFKSSALTGDRDSNT